MKVILVLLCLAIAGRELYLAFDRRRRAGPPEIADIRTQLTALKDTRDELEHFRSAQRERLERLTAERTAELAPLAAGQDRLAESLRETDDRIGSLVAQINDRMVPEVNERLNTQKAALERLTADVAALRAHLVARLDQAVAASLGAEPADLVAASLTAVPAAARAALAGPFERFLERYGLWCELADGDRYYLSGRSPRGLERDFLELLTARGASGAPAEAEALLTALRGTARATAQVGPLLIVRTPEELLCGVLPLAELRLPETAALLDDPSRASARLRRLPAARLLDAS
ncbi:hypothetical protein [Actinomadura montaniterrae]|uniref:Uncharacterized protein n=1 Tax=Actinomadura montaniterrae TaxID=1803903 RepID=A0A6L3VKB4_9ACTN|nr:hypothetical protein [Actinomadura montaniterrae]KAB2371667.1 hypothetical protein F9B16_31625 [Actinomadura montaniterrae]